ncbi:MULTISPECIES: YjcZ family sporulation protein [Bacillus]|nr:YjcZ family sporulation protein [Bacillus smithii]
MGWSHGCGYGGYGYDGGYSGGLGSTFVLIVVLFILLIIVGTSFVG